jgi:hypothetical protein
MTCIDAPPVRLPLLDHLGSDADLRAIERDNACGSFRVSRNRRRFVR